MSKRQSRKSAKSGSPGLRSGGWDEYQRLVIDRLGEHSDSLSELREDVQSIRSHDIPDLKVEIAMLKVKSGLWGAAAGLVPSIATLLYVWIQKSF